MHCSKEKEAHSRKFFKVPLNEGLSSKVTLIPVCSECGANMKPHEMFFDE